MPKPVVKFHRLKKGSRVSTLTLARRTQIVVTSGLYFDLPDGADDRFHGMDFLIGRVGKCLSELFCGGRLIDVYRWMTL